MCNSGIGGQAVLEGVMMKNKELYAVAVRKPDGEIEIDQEEYHSIAHGLKLVKVPFIRGVFNFIDSLILGMRTLDYSSKFYEDENATDSKMDKAFGEKSEKVFSAITIIISFVIAIALFMVLPYFISTLIQKEVRNNSLITIFEGLIRLLIFLIYIVVITAMKDIRRLYMYHGAEHKCINCIEHGKVLNVKNVKNSSRLHRRCGTSFLLFVMIVSIILFMFIKVDGTALKIVLRIALLPVIAGISYEIIRLAGKSENIIVKILSAPGLLLQRLTTKEPDEDMIEVAIRSVEAVFDWKQFLIDNFEYLEEDLIDEE
ncbi:MAG: DUF1385 domain-containing protein [Lachnospiraceae bacterium]|nr:DUF1385 domain-containing protein [Candidatus Colinaster scatohippi]